MIRITGGTLEARAPERAALDNAGEFLLDTIGAIEIARGVRFDLGDATRTEPVGMHAGLTEHLAASAGPGVFRMPSGAGHDAAVFAQESIPSGMIFIRNANGSHNPNEAMALDDFCVGTSVLFRSLLTMPREIR